MNTRRSLLGATCAACLGLGLAFARPQGQAAVETRPVHGAVSVLVAAGGGNVGVSAGPDGILLVDDQFERIAPGIEAALKELAPGSAGSVPRYLVNTHHHGDHTDGNKHFGKLATVVAHANVRTRMQADKAPAHALPVVTFADGVALHFNGEEVRVLHVPNGHTDGDSVVWFRGAGVIHLGDLYFQVGYPFVDVSSGGNVLGLIEGLRGLLEELPDDVRVIPGHGDVTGKKELEEYVRMLETISARVQEHLGQGHDLEAMLAAGVTKDFDERWGHFDFVPPRAFVQSVLASLK